MLKKLVSDLIVWLVLAHSISICNAQLPKCGNPPVMENNCADACVVCDLNGLTTRNGHTVPGNAPAGFCTQILHSIRYIAFVAGSTQLSFQVQVGACRFGHAIELGVYGGDCNHLELVSNCNTFMPTGGTFSFSTTKDLEIGCTYYLVVDGNGPADCSFTVSVRSGSARAPVPTIDGIMGKRQVCLGDVETYVLRNPYGGCKTTWRVQNATVISQGSREQTVMFDRIGVARICATIANECNKSGEVCTEVRVGDKSPPTDLYYSVCPGGFIEIGQIRYYAGQYQLNLKNKTGCDSTVNMLIEEEQAIEGSVDTSVCYPDCIRILNKVYCDSGTYHAVLRSRIKPFCDSNVLISINLLHAEPRISSDGPLNCNKPFAWLYADSSIIRGKGKISYLWQNGNFDTIGTEKAVAVNQPGKYYLTISIKGKDGHTCAQRAEFDLSGHTVPPALIQVKPIFLCKGEKLLDIKSYVEDIHNTDSDVFIYSSADFSAQTEIRLSEFEPHTDTSVYVLFEVKNSHGICRDTILVRVNLINTPRIQVTSHPICQGDHFTEDDLLFSLPSAKDSLLGIFSCPQATPHCRLQLPLHVTADTVIYLLIANGPCPFVMAHHIHSALRPRIRASLFKRSFCLGESIKLSQSPMQRDEKRKIYFDNFETEPSDTLVELIAAKKGLHRIVVEAELNGCRSKEEFEVEIEQAEEFPDIICTSTDTSILFTWHTMPRRFPFQVERLSARQFKRLNDHTIYFDSLQAGEKVGIRCRLLDSICGFQVRDIECEALQCPTIQLIANLTDSFCISPNEVNLQQFRVHIQNPQPGFVGRWSGPGLKDSLQGIFNLSEWPEGRNLIVFEYNYKTCRNKIELPVFLYHNPDFAIHSRDSICQDSLIHISLHNINNPEFSYIWDFDHGNITQVNSRQEYFVKWSEPGYKKITSLVQNRHCAVKRTKDIFVIRKPSPAAINCHSTNNSILVELQLDSATDGAEIEIEPAYPMQKVSAHVWKIHDLPPGTECRIKSRTWSHPACAESVSQWHTCKTTNCPDRNILQDTGFVFCASDTLRVIALSPLRKETFGPYRWHFDGKPITDTLYLRHVGAGKHILQLYAEDGPCIYRDTIIVEIFQNPKVHRWIIEEIRCTENGRYGSITVANEQNNEPLRYFLNGQLFSSADFGKLVAGRYDLKITNAAGCSFDTSITLHDPPIPEVDAGADQYIRKGESRRISPLVKGDYILLSWDNKAGLSCDDCLNPLATPDRDQMYVLTVENKFGCRSQDTVWIWVSDNQVWAPTIFSPNGDRINDVFTLYGSKDLEIIEQLQIFDRWGEQLFIKKDFLPNLIDSGWDGTYRQRPMLPGVYVYIAKVRFKNRERMTLRGEIHLVR